MTHGDGLLTSNIVPFKNLKKENIKELFELYFKYFENVTQEIFFEHISKKDDIILLTDKKENKIRGFSTLKILNVKTNGTPIKAVFTGDTIIDQQFWGEQELVRAFNYYCGLQSKNTPQNKVYWFLISKGYKTYRYLPVFTKKYYPTYKEPTPKFDQLVLDTLAKSLYPNEYDPKSGLIKFEKSVGNLRDGVGDVTPERLKNQDVRFFNEKNPGYKKGIELACLTEMSIPNLKSIAKIYFEKGLKD